MDREPRFDADVCAECDEDGAQEVNGAKMKTKEGRKVLIIKVHRLCAYMEILKLCILLFVYG